MLVYALFTMDVMNAEMVYTLLAIPLMVTAIMAWDPIYALLRINSFASRNDVETAEPEANEHILTKFYEFPQNIANVNYPKAA
jgi:hypothetical protein